MNNQLNPDPQGGESNMSDEQTMAHHKLVPAFGPGNPVCVFKENGFICCGLRDNPRHQAEGATTQPTTIKNTSGMVVCEHCRKSNGEHSPDDQCIDNRGHLLGTDWKPWMSAQPLPSAGSKPQEDGDMRFFADNQDTKFSNEANVESDAVFIGTLRRELFMPYDCKWNGYIRDITAELERNEGVSRRAVYEHIFKDSAVLMTTLDMAKNLSQPVADGGGLQEWEALKAAAEKAEIGEWQVVRGKGGDGWTICSLGDDRDGNPVSIETMGVRASQLRCNILNDAEFFAAASPENILKLLAAYASSQEALSSATVAHETAMYALGSELTALKERMQQAMEKLEDLAGFLPSNGDVDEIAARKIRETLSILSPRGSSKEGQRCELCQPTSVHGLSRTCAHKFAKSPEGSSR